MAESRWINVTAPFQFTWPNRSVTVFRADHMGDHLVKAELADFAVERGHATEGKADEASRSTKGGKRARRAPSTAKTRKAATGRRKAGKAKIDALAANLQPVDRLDGADMADADRSDDRDSVDSDASER